MPVCFAKVTELRKPKKLWPTAVFRNGIQHFLMFSDVMSSLGETSHRGDFQVAACPTPKRLWPTPVLRNDICGFLVFSDVMSSLGETSRRGDFSVAARPTPKRLWSTAVLRNDIWDPVGFGFWGLGGDGLRQGSGLRICH